MRVLNDGEVERLMTNSADVRERVTMHNNLVSNGAWDQIAWAQLDNVPIPVRGYVTQDIWLGTVILAPDARGAVHFLYPEGTEAIGVIKTINNAAYHSSDEGLAALINDMIRRALALKDKIPSAPDIASLVAIGAGIALVVWAAK